MPDPWIIARRLASSGLVEPRFATPEEVVGWFGAVQSQDVPGASWALGQRLPDGTTIAVIDEALDAGRILRTHTMRPTWHFVLPEDLRWLLALTSPRVQRLVGTYYRKFELDPTTLARMAEVMAGEVEGGRAATKAELKAALERAGLPAHEMRVDFAVMHAEFEGLLVSGPRRGKVHTYALVEERVPAAPSIARDEALAELTRRYFRSHGPAEPRDFAWWSGLTIADAKAGLAALGPEVEQRTIDGIDWFWIPSAIGEPPPALPSPTVHLLPNFDEYTVSYRNREPIADASLLGDRTLLEVFSWHIVALDGQLVGGWKRQLGQPEAIVEPDLLVELDAAGRAAFEQAAAAYGRFLGLPPRIDWA